MSMAIAHFAVGATLTAVLLAVVAPAARYPRALTTVGGVWALLPDVYWAIPLLEPVLRPLHRSAWANAFWFHRWLDVVDPSNARPFAAGTVVVFVVAVLFVERWQSGVERGNPLSGEG